MFNYPFRYRRSRNTWTFRRKENNKSFGYTFGRNPTEEDKDYFLKVVSHAEFEEISNAAHMVAGDKNDIFSKAVEKFLVKNN